MPRRLRLFRTCCGVLARLSGDQRGSILILAGLTFTVVISFVALATDVALFYAQRQAMQNAADAAALGAAQAYAAGNTAGYVAEGRGNAAVVGFVNGQNNVTVSINLPPTQGAYNNVAGYIEAKVSQPVTPVFMALVMPSGWHPTVTAVAVANAGGAPGNSCVLALDSVDPSDLSLAGTPDVTMSGCGVTVNSSSTSALTMKGGASLTADFVQVVGGITNPGDITAPDILTGVSPVSDPYANVPAPSFNAASGADVTVHGSNNQLSPGVYNSLSFNANSTATLAPGVYIINGGNLKIDGGATITGAGVTFYLTGSGNAYSSVTLNGNANINISAPTSGTYSGLVMYQDRSAPSSIKNTVDGGAVTDFTGALYFPTTSIDFSGGASTSGCTQIVADRISFGGNATIGANCSGTGTTSISSGSVRLVQ